MPEPEARPAADLTSLPPEWPDAGLRRSIRERVIGGGMAVVVVDDDPTGTQTVHDVPVLTAWSEAGLRRELAQGTPVFYVLTNSRALTRSEAVALALDLGANLARAARAAGREVTVVSRSDSTLRGHYPAETDALAQGLRYEPDAVLIAPYFREGGRFTIDDVHYVQEGDLLVPAARTEFARDPVFGYSHSWLPAWVEEKTAGRRRAADVLSLPLAAIREGGPDEVARRLGATGGGRPVIVNAASDRDLEVVVCGMLRAEEQGRRFLCRTAASFAKVRGGISDRGLLSAAEMADGGGEMAGGLVVVGSHVPRSTRQLQTLLALPGWHGVELEVAPLLDDACREQHLAEAIGRVAAGLGGGGNVALYTSRSLVTGADPEQSLAIAKTVSRCLVEVVRRLERRPRFLIAKGGITSSDVATAGLGVERAMVLGQIAPGVPVWRLGAESRFPGLPYVVFPGNVGRDGTLAEIAAAMER